MTTITTDEVRTEKAAQAERRKRAERWDPNADKGVAAAIKRRDDIKAKADKLVSQLDALEAAEAQRRSEVVSAVADGASVDIDIDEPGRAKLERKLSIARDALAVAESRIATARRDATDRLRSEFRKQHGKTLRAAADAGKQFLEAHRAAAALADDAELHLQLSYGPHGNFRFSAADRLEHWTANARDGELDAR